MKENETTQGNGQKINKIEKYYSSLTVCGN